jgi:aspartate kinase
VDDIIQVIHEGETSADISFTIDAADKERAASVVRELMGDMPGMKTVIKEGRAKVSVVGVGMRTHSGVASQMFEALHQAKVNIENISTSEIVISCVISAADGERALRAIHTAFGLDVDAGKA